MGELTDPRPLARVATIVLAVWIVAKIALQVALMVGIGPPEHFHAYPHLSAVVAVGALFQVGAFVLSIIVVGRWMWRVNSNAHGLANGMSITPGWAVGWFFVPVASLFKPFEAMKETWQVSHDPDNWPNVAVPALLRWWWGLWVVSNIVGGVLFQLNRLGISTRPTDPAQLIYPVLIIAAGVVLIRLMRVLSAAQARAIAAQAFA